MPMALAVFLFVYRIRLSTKHRIETMKEYIAGAFSITAIECKIQHEQILSIVNLIEWLTFASPNQITVCRMRSLLF